MWWNKYIKVPFLERGRDENGWDCWGVPFVTYEKELGIHLPTYLECYETTQDREVLSEVINRERNAHWITPEDDPQEFDIIILNMRGVPMHVGVVTKKNHMIHCAKGIGTVHENFTTSRWKHKVVGFARWKE